MKNQALFEVLLDEEKDGLNFKEVQQIKLQDQANKALIEHKIQKQEKPILQPSNRFNA